MNDFSGVRLGIFLGVLLACAAAERLLPRRKPTAGAGLRWSSNLTLAVLGAVLVRLLIPFTLVEAAYKVEAARLGLLNQAPIYFPLKFVLSFLILDLLIYFQHRLFHWSPALWRLHAVHHTDLDLDASSGVRFHPGEILLSAVIKLAAIAVFGTHFLAVLAFEVVLNATSLFNHANIRLGPLDALLRLVVVTPDMHRVHHSPTRTETDSNFSFNFPWWDRLFGTYRAQPREPHETMALGLSGSRRPEELGLFALLGRPFKRTS
ncbi:MAG: sterol desaturase family protein [Elusimicrobiota bacterium]|nr:sterol desaturase family protein [Elusimicrobiota bacterium]